MAELKATGGNWRQQLMHAEDRPAVELAIAHAPELASPLEVEHRALLPDGSVRWIQVRAVPLMDSEGNVSEWR
ncbi:hypothetical protein G6F32_017191 [Rhizopus arrhizus]|nr:hypothetical protein G6F32_017191 [Rhizopus arrhizus]